MSATCNLIIYTGHLPTGFECYEFGFKRAQTNKHSNFWTFVYALILGSGNSYLIEGMIIHTKPEFFFTKTIGLAHGLVDGWITLEFCVSFCGWATCCAACEICHCGCFLGEASAVFISNCIRSVSPFPRLLDWKPDGADRASFKLSHSLGSNPDLLQSTR